MKICILHRYPPDQIKSTNASFPYIVRQGVDVKTFKKFDRVHNKLWKSLLWIFYAPLLVIGRDYDVIYCDDSFPFYPALVKMVCPHSKVIIRLGDLHLMYYFKGWVYRFFHFFEKIEWHMVDGIVAISEVMGQHIMKEINKSVFIALDPVDPTDFVVSEKHEQHFPFKDATNVLFHGTITKNKGLEVLIEAARRLPDIQFHIVGDGDARKKLSSESPSNVWYYGWQPFDKIKEFIEECDIGIAMRTRGGGNEFVVTSPWLQYGVMGKPCIVTRRKVFEEMKYPWQFETVDELVALIPKLAGNKEEGERMKKFIFQWHTAQAIGEQIWSLLSSLAQTPLNP